MHESSLKGNFIEIPLSKTSSIIVAPGANYYQYDLDGNLIQGDAWDYYWDGENRLVKMIARIPQQNAPNDPLQLDFEYDYLGRRIKKTVLRNNSTTTVKKFVYDRWRLIAELDGNNDVIRTYGWGLDISGTLDGAAGIGGLLRSAEEGGDNPVYYTYDTRGNVTSVVAENGTIMAEYEYGPFGEPLRATGPLAETNPFRFSTKYHDDETGLIYYGYRYYNPKTGRWISRDPIGEDGGLNLYGFVNNNPIELMDFLGLEIRKPSAQESKAIHDVIAEIASFNSRILQDLSKSLNTRVYKIDTDLKLPKDPSKTFEAGYVIISRKGCEGNTIYLSPDLFNGKMLSARIYSQDGNFSFPQLPAHIMIHEEMHIKSANKYRPTKDDKVHDWIETYLQTLDKIMNLLRRQNPNNKIGLP